MSSSRLLLALVAGLLLLLAGCATVPSSSERPPARPCPDSDLRVPCTYGADGHLYRAE